MRILVIEDDLSLGRLICGAFQSAGVEAVCEPTAETAIVALANETFDVALVDIVLPGTSGFYVIDAIRTLPPARRPDVIVTTGADPVKLTAIDRSVVKAILFKPLDIPSLVAFVTAGR